MVARAGYTPAPGATGALFNYSASTFYRPVINDTGKLLFQAYIAGGTINDTGLSAATTPRQGLFTGTPCNLTDIAYVGDPAPDGGTFTSFGGTYAENDLGEVVFSAIVTGSPYTGTQWFGTTPTGQIQELLAVGQTFMVNGVPETISGFGVNVIDSGGEDGLTNAWNDQGELAATIDFSNGTGGVFLVAVPEPASLALLTIPALALLRRRPRRDSRGE